MEIKSIVGARLGSLSLKRSTSTNPFDKTSFRGKTFSGSVLPFADVFQKIKPVEDAKPSKLARVSGAVIGAVSSFRTRITEPVIAFAHRVKDGISNGIDAVKNVGISAKETILSAKNSIVNAKNSLVEMHKNLQDRISQVFDWHKVSEPEVDGVAKVLSIKNINEHASVKDLKATWLSENAKITESEAKAVA